MSTLSAGGTDAYGFTLSVKSDGSVQSWGSNGFGQLGNNDIGMDSDVPMDVLGPDGSTSLQNIVTVAAGDTHALALREDGTVWSWGQTKEGMLGISELWVGEFGFSGVDSAGDPIEYVPFAVPVCSLTDIVAIAAGAFHSLALNNVGQVYSFGDNRWGQLGDGSATDDKGLPVEVMETATGVFGDISVIAAGHFHSLAVDTSGNVYAWGRNEYGPLGNLDMGVDSAYPVAVVDESGSPINNIVDIDGGYAHSLALDSSGVVYGWGDNYWGQLADSSMDTSAPHSDQARDYSDEVTALSAYTVTDVEAGQDHSLVTTSGGEVLGFGWGTLGQTGDGNAAERDYTPVAAVFPSSTVDPVSVSAWGSHVAVLSQNSSSSDGTVYVFGDDREGQLGIGGASDSCTLGTAVVTCEKTPVMVSVATEVMLP
jgi:alpha-tubulin suppressor-like RCC1 family protein